MYEQTNKYIRLPVRKLIIIPRVCSSSMLRVSWYVFYSMSLLFDYMSMRLPFIPWSIAGMLSSQALLGFLITAPPPVLVPVVLGALAVWIGNQIYIYIYIYIYLFASKVSSSTRCARCVRHSQDFPPRAQYMHIKHFHDAKSWTLFCINPAPATSSIALLHRNFLSFASG